MAKGVVPYSSRTDGRLAAQIEGVGGFGLHAEGGLHGLDAAFEELVLADGLFVVAVELLHEVQLPALGRRGQLRVPQVADHPFRVGDGIVEGGALMARGQKAAAQAGAAAAAGTEDDEAGQVLVFGAQAVGDPRAHRRPRGGDVAGMKQAAGGRVGGVEGVHRADDAEVVGERGEVGQQFADFEAGLAVLSEVKGRRQQAAGGALGAQVDGIGALAGVLSQGGLGIEHVDLRRAAGQEQDDVVLRPGGEVRRRRATCRPRACSSASMPSGATDPRPAPRERIMSRREMGWFMAKRSPRWCKARRGRIPSACRWRGTRRPSVEFVLAGIARQHLAVHGTDLGVDVGFLGDAAGQRGGLVAHERAVHDEQLLKRRGGGLAAGAVHRGFGEAVELQQVVEAAAADAGVNGAAVVAGLIEVGRRAAQTWCRDCRPLAGCSRDRPRCPGGAGSCARAGGWRDRS